MGANRLDGETSPYLRQHRLNPVDWFPWGEEALDRARRDDRPIFLSIGYSACHWCHVMAHESFEDGETARYLNEHFVCVKVDREERPDLDALYMRAVTLMTGSGGWPLTVFLTPDRRPFFGGTYFPKEPRWGAPSFRQVLEGVVRAYATRRSELEGASDRLLAAVRETFSPPDPKRVQGAALAGAAREALMARFDEREGGFGSGPKFPQPPLLRFLLDHARLHGDDALRDAVLFTLRTMEAGGVRDQVGGGFHRYSVDGQWRVPHYEKMLYDNAQLASLYFRAAALPGAEDLARVGREALADVTEAFSAPGGGFCASLDADSEGEEGRFYLWSPAQVEAVLGPEEGRRVAALFGLGPGEDLAHRTLHRVAPWGAAAREVGEEVAAFRARVDRDLRRLREARADRVPPARDTKVLTDWNALAAQAFFDGYVATGDPRYLTAGEESLEFLWRRCWDGATLHHVWDGERARVPGFLADHAYLAQAEWAAFQATGSPGHLGRAGLLLDLVRRRFVDGETGALFDAPPSEGGLLLAVRDADDGVLPSPIAAYAHTLWGWARLTGGPGPAKDLERLLRLESGALVASPGALPLLAGLAELTELPPAEVVVAAPSLEQAEPWLSQARALAPPGMLVLPLLADRMARAEAEAYALFAGRWRSAGPAAYLCVGGTCRTPFTSPGQLGEALGALRGPAGVPGR